LRIYKKYSGIIVRYDNIDLSLDTSDYDTDLSFISHAHHDHLPIKVNRLYASRETIVLSSLRGFKYDTIIEIDKNLRMTNSGHILGSKLLMIKDKILYTGDICTRDRGFLKGAEPIECRVLIIESTYGVSYFKFPNLNELVNEANRIIRKNLDEGRHVLLMGYELGKAQLLTYIFKNYKLIIHDRIANINALYKNLGVDLYDYEALPLSIAESKNILKKEPQVIISPMSKSFEKNFKSKYNAVSIAFTGWAMSNRFDNYDYALPLSDHADYYELIDFVKKCNPDKILTFHGFTKEFASSLHELGFDASEISNDLRLDEFF